MSNQFGDTRIDDDLTLLSETLEEVLRSSGDPADQKYVELKARAEKALDDVKKRVSGLQTVITIGRSRQFIVLMTTSTKTPQGIGVGATVGLVLDCCWHAVKTSLHRGTAFFCSTPYNVRLLTGRGPRAIT